MIPEGIYLRTKKSTRGVGHTATEQCFRFFYALRHAGEGQVELSLLDEGQKLKPTGFREVVPLREVADLVHVPKLQPFFERLQSSLGAVTPAAKPAAPTAAPAPKAAPPAAQPEQKEEGGWWEMTSRGSGMLGKKL